VTLQSMAPRTAPIAEAPKIHQHVQRLLIREIETPAIEASCELTIQRDEIDAWDRLDDDRDTHLTSAERAVASGDASLARYHLGEAKRLDAKADALIVRIGQRRASAHGYTRAIAGNVEKMLTGRCRDV